MTEVADIIPQGTFDDRPAWLVSNQAEGTQPAELEIDGKPHTYTVVKSGLAPELPYTVGYPDPLALFVSEDVPVEDRPFILSHEVREKTRPELLELPEEQRCTETVKLEFADVQTQAPERYASYVRQRGAFFDALDGLYDQPQQAKAVTPQFRQGIKAARARIQSVISTLPNAGMPQGK